MTHLSSSSTSALSTAPSTALATTLSTSPTNEPVTALLTAVITPAPRTTAHPPPTAPGKDKFVELVKKKSTVENDKAYCFDFIGDFPVELYDIYCLVVQAGGSRKVIWTDIASKMGLPDEGYILDELKETYTHFAQSIELTWHPSFFGNSDTLLDPKLTDMLLDITTPSPPTTQSRVLQTDYYSKLLVSSRESLDKAKSFEWDALEHTKITMTEILNDALQNLEVLEQEPETYNSRPPFRARSRLVTSFGGITSEALNSVIPPVKPTKDIYGPIKYKTLACQLASDSAFHIRLALDQIVTCSMDGSIQFDIQPEVGNQILILTRDSLAYLLKGIDPLNYQFQTYSELYQQDWEAQFSIRAGMAPMLDPRDSCLQRLDCLSTILRNCSFDPENGRFLSRYDGFLDVLETMLRLQEPPQKLPTTPGFHTLEHRKNVVVIFCNLGSILELPLSLFQLLFDVLSDFMAEKEGPYCVSALDALSKVLLVPQNQALVPQLLRVPELVLKLSSFLPISWSELSTQDELLFCLLTTMNLLSLVSAGSPSSLTKISSNRHFIHTMVACSRLPSSKSHLSMYREEPRQILPLNEFVGLCERCLRVLKECAKDPVGKDMIQRFEWQLLDVSLSSATLPSASILCTLASHVLYDVTFIS